MRVLEDDIYEFGKFRLDAAHKVLRFDGEIIALSLKSVELLCVLVENRGEVVSKKEIFAQVWEDAFVEDSVLTQNIYTLRKMFEERGETALIKTVPRRGYIFNFEEKEATDALVIERNIYEEIEIEETETISATRKYWKFGLIPAALIIAIAGFAAVYLRPPKQEAKTNRVISIAPVSAASSKLKSLAVLPFTISDEKENAFADSLTNDLTVRLGSLNKFRVLPHFIVKNATRIKSDFILTGKISVSGDKFKIQTIVRDVGKDADVLTKTFDAEQNNLVQLEDAISNGAANAILGTLPQAEKDELTKRLPTNFAAYETYQAGFEIWRKRHDATAYFEKAVELDANFARAYGGLASAKIFDPQTKREIAENLEKALKIEPDSAEANAVIGFVKIFQEHDWTQAETTLKNALEADSGNVNAHHWLGIFYAIHRRLDEAKAEINAAIELDETNPTLFADLGMIQNFAGENEAAAASCQKALELDANSDFARKCLDDLQKPLPDKATALNEIIEMERTGNYNLVFTRVSNRYAEVQNEPKVRKILRKINLDE